MYYTYNTKIYSFAEKTLAKIIVAIYNGCVGRVGCRAAPLFAPAASVAPWVTRQLPKLHTFPTWHPLFKNVHVCRVFKWRCFRCQPLNELCITFPISFENATCSICIQPSSEGEPLGIFTCGRCHCQRKNQYHVSPIASLERCSKRKIHEVRAN